MLVTYFSAVVLPVVAQVPRIPLALTSVPSVAAALKLVKSTTAPVRVKVPVTFSVRSAAANQLCLPSKVSPLAMVRFWVAVLRSMPELPRVSVLPAPRVTKPPGSLILIPAQLRSAPSRGLLAATTAESHRATSAAPGTTSQLEARLRLSALFSLKLVAPCETVTRLTKASAKAAPVKRREIGWRYFIISG